MAKKQTKQNILQTGAEIVWKKGFYHTGLMEILRTAGVPKGSFYFYFESKDQFGAELIDFFTEFILQNMDDHFYNSAFTPLENLKRFLDERKKIIENEEYKGGCPIGNLSQETGDINEMLSFKLQHALRQMSGKFKKCLDAAKKQGEIPEAIDTRVMSDFILNSWEGALIRMKVEKSSAPMNQFEDLLFNKLLK